MTPDDPSTTGQTAVFPLLNITGENDLHDIGDGEIQPSGRACDSAGHQRTECPPA
ncbi:hypothetical protein [Dyella jiangningensis]